MKKQSPQKGNPYGLTVKQHIFPAASIDRFVDNNGTVEVKRIGSEESFQAKPDNPIFCAHFVWDHGSESGFMKRIEDQYQCLINEVVSKSIFSFSEVQNKLITEMYALCCARFLLKKTPMFDQVIDGMEADNPTKDEQEIMEKKGAGYVRSDRSVSGRFLTGMLILVKIDSICSQMAGFNWGIISAKLGEFIVPDNFIQHTYLPLSPSMILAVNQTNRSVGFEEVERINRNAIKSSDTYFFARKLSACPLLKPLFVFIQNELLNTKTASISESGFPFKSTNPIK
jgi:hypothetical protein